MVCVLLEGPPEVSAMMTSKVCSEPMIEKKTDSAKWV